MAVDFSQFVLDLPTCKPPFANVTVLHKDEALSSALGLFDHIICRSGLVLLNDIPSTLGNWHDLLAPGGLIILDGSSEDALVPGL